MSFEQFGFHAGLGTRDALCALLQKCQAQRRDINICFIDLEKAFDINHIKRLQILNYMELDDNETRLIQNFYLHLLLNLYAEVIWAFENTQDRK